MTGAAWPTRSGAPTSRRSGPGALAGAGYPLDREATARDLGFDGVTRNSLDAVSDRDFVVETEAALALVMVHLSRLAEEIVWWSNPRFGFVRVADAFSTGSSMMPNKKNPDPAELIRGRVGRVIGALTGTLTMLKGLPLAYQRDLQEDKPPLFDAATTTEASMRVMAGLVATMAIDRERMAAAAGEGFTTATAVADGLVRRGVPFRVAHHIVGSLVAERGTRRRAAPRPVGHDDPRGARRGRRRDRATALHRPCDARRRPGIGLGRGRPGRGRRHRRQLRPPGWPRSWDAPASGSPGRRDPCRQADPLIGRPESQPSCHRIVSEVERRRC